MLGLQHIEVLGAGRSERDRGQRLQGSLSSSFTWSCEALARGCCGCVELAQVLERLDEEQVSSWLGKARQANHSRLRKSSELKIVGGWESIGLGDSACLPCCCSWVAVGGCWLLVLAGLQGKGGPSLPVCSLSPRCSELCCPMG